MRYAIYARYSSDNSAARSIDDQILTCRAAIARAGGTVVAVFSDAAISGFSIVNRPGVRALLEAAKTAAFDAVFAEDMDRVSRDQEDIAHIAKRLKFVGVKFVTVADGEIGPLHIGLKGTMNALDLEKIRAKVLRGQTARAREGLAQAGLAYGYRVRREIDAKGELQRGLREIDEAKANVVRRIFREYLAGQTAREIAKGLNLDGVPAPAGGKWSPNTIVGSRARATGILHNEIYVGRMTFNRQSFIKDPDSGRRVPRRNPKADWIVAELPELRIVDAETWAAAHTILDQRGGSQAATGAPGGDRRRPGSLLAGLIFCARCGSPYVTRAAGRLACKANRYHGTCDNGLSIRTNDLEERVLAGLRDNLAAPDIVAAAVEEYRQEMKRLRADAQSRRGRHADELRDLTAKIARAVAAVLDGMDSPAVRDKLAEMEHRKAEIEADAAIADAAGDVVELHPKIAGIYRARVAEMIARLNGDAAARREAVGYVRSLVDRITLHPPQDGRRLDIELKGQLAALFEVIPPPERRQNAAFIAGVSVGSGGGI